MKDHIHSPSHLQHKTGQRREYIMMELDGQLFGMDVSSVEDVLSPQQITRIPLAPPEVLGTLNLRGRIVTAVNLRSKLNMPEPADKSISYRSVVVALGDELYSLLLDKVSEVLNIYDSEIAPSPENLPERWKSVSNGVYSMENELMVILDVHKLLNLDRNNERESGM